MAAGAGMADKIDARRNPTLSQPDQFIPVRKSDIVKALIAGDGLADDRARGDFRLLCRMLGAIYHYTYFDQLERLRSDYFYFNPEITPPGGAGAQDFERARADLAGALEQVLTAANFVEIPQDEIERAHRERAEMRVALKTPVEDFRQVRFFRRGHRVREIEISEWFGLRKRRIEIDVYDDIVLFVAMRDDDAPEKQNGRRLHERMVRPGSILIKYFRNIASADLNALYPNVRVVMSNVDKLVLGVPALAGGIPIVMNLVPALSVAFLVIGFYLGISGAVEDDEIKKAFAALSGLVALGGFLFQQWVKYQRQSLKYQKALTDNIYYRNINNNAGIFDYLIGAAEEQECKEAFLAYFFLQRAAEGMTQPQLDRMIESWLREQFGIAVNFEVTDALAKLDRLGILRRDGDVLRVAPLPEALKTLDRVWDGFFGTTA